MADRPPPADLPVQFEIGRPWNRPEQNVILKPAPSALVPPDVALREAAKLGNGEQVCANCRYFDLEAGQRVLASGNARSKRNVEAMRRSGYWKPTEYGACRLDPAFTATQAVATCPKWEPRGKLVSFSGQRNRSG